MAHFHTPKKSFLRQKQLSLMVLENFFQEIFMKTQISQVKEMFYAIFDDFNNENRNGCGFWAKIGVKNCNKNEKMFFGGILEFSMK